MTQFDYSAPAEIFCNAGDRRRRAMRYRRFSTGADAVRFALEELPASLLIGITLESDEDRFDHAGIRALYESPDYPLARHDAQN